MSEEQKRRHYTSKEKVAILKEHLAGKRPVSEVCERHGLAPNMFYRWQEEFFMRAEDCFDKPATGRPSAAARAAEKRCSEMALKMARKNEVLSELMEEHVALKKKLGLL
jgi:transposase